MRDLSPRQVYSFLQSKMADLAMNSLLLQGHGLLCLLQLLLSCSNSLKVIHCYYIPNAPDFFPLALTVPSETWNDINTSQQHYYIPVPHWLLYFKVIFPQNLFRTPLSSTIPKLYHRSQQWANPAHHIYWCNIFLTISNDLWDKRSFSSGLLPRAGYFH